MIAKRKGRSYATANTTTIVKPEGNWLESRICACVFGLSFPVEREIDFYTQTLTTKTPICSSSRMNPQDPIASSPEKRKFKIESSGIRFGGNKRSPALLLGIYVGLLKFYLSDRYEQGRVSIRARLSGLEVTLSYSFFVSTTINEFGIRSKRILVTRGEVEGAEKRKVGVRKSGGNLKGLRRKDQVDSTGNTTMMNLRFNVLEQNPTCAPIRAECVLSMIENRSLLPDRNSPDSSAGSMIPVMLCGVVRVVRGDTDQSCVTVNERGYRRW
ncbi:hypothetical protein HZH68_005272 [Vespula germanica]|uniref:Uncharacterized protein n=1 Tax=Vespula germanica TaxID=30212 RepID=A0A834NFU4_VESGE|nr:hypothetical protein HZH68_005272 [Vespula germanica]